MPPENPYIHSDEHGVLRVAQTPISLDSVLAAWDRGDSPESIRSQYPSLTLEEVYGAITWCLAHPNEVAQYMKKQDAVWEYWRERSESEPSALRDRLRAIKAKS